MIEAHKVGLKEESFNLRECLVETVEMMKDKAQKKGLKLELQVSPSVSDVILGDPYRIGQILLNLIGNAIKFTDEGNVTVNVNQKNSKIVFCVYDTGLGLPEDKFEEVFESFKQLDNSSTRLHGGAGLGLAISKGLAELMGGHIFVNSVLGKGSEFCFTLPTQKTYSNHK